LSAVILERALDDDRVMRGGRYWTQTSDFRRVATSGTLWRVSPIRFVPGCNLLGGSPCRGFTNATRDLVSA
jgi:hypothetical protein